MTDRVAKKDLLAAARLFLPALRELAERRPDEVQAVCAEAGIEPRALEDLRARIPLGNALRFLRAACIATGDPLFPLAATRRYDRGTYDLFMRTLLAQPDGDAAMAKARSLSALPIEGLEIAYEASPRMQRVVFTLQNAPIDDPLLAEYLFGLVAELTAHVGRSHLPVLEVELVHGPRAPLAAYRARFGAPVHFGRPRTTLALPSVNLELPDADPVLATLLLEQAEAWVRTLPSAASYRSRVETFLRQRLGHGAVTVDEAARALGMSPRTLRRRLEDEGTSYVEVLDDHRRARALAMLHDPSRGIAEIAFAIGFESTGAFRRAFARWTGTSATRYRAALAEA